MSNQRSSKRHLEKARQEKAALKRDKRQGKGPDGLPLEGEEEAGPRLSQDEIVAALAALQASYDDGQVSLDDFDEQRSDLMAQFVI
jgi:hypothetical protein